MVDIASIIAGITAVLAMVTKIYNAIQAFIKTVQPIIEEAEKKALDGIIDTKDRKELVSQTVDLLVASGKIKIPWFVKPFMGKIINAVAKKLPDFQVKKLAAAMSNEVVKKIKATA